MLQVSLQEVIVHPIKSVCQYLKKHNNFKNNMYKYFTTESIMVCWFRNAHRALWTGIMDGHYGRALSEIKCSVKNFIS